MAEKSVNNGTRTKPTRSHRDLDVYKCSVSHAMEIFEYTKSFPKEEAYSLTSQIRRSSRSVSANIVEGWRKRRYEAAFISKFSDAETEAAETQVWLEYVVKCGYLGRADAADLYKKYEKLLRSIVGMIQHSKRWVIQPRPND